MIKIKNQYSMMTDDGTGKLLPAMMSATKALPSGGGVGGCSRWWLWLGGVLAVGAGVVVVQPFKHFDRFIKQASQQSAIFRQTKPVSY